MDDRGADLTGGTRTVCGVVRTSLGPFGTSKLVLTEQGEVSTAGSARAILDGLDVEEPMVTVLADAATEFDDRYRDGTTTLLALAGALLEEAERLSETGVHPTVVGRGYRDACEVARASVEDHARPVSSVGTAAVARTSLTGTRDPVTRETVSEYVAEAVEETDAGEPADGRSHTDGVAVRTRVGPPSETALVRGVVLDYERITDASPDSVTGGVAVLSETVDAPSVAGETARSDRTASLSVDSFEQRRSIREYEREAFEDRVAAAVDAGCRFVATGMAVNDRVKRRLANSGVAAVQRVDGADLRRLALATGAAVCPSLEEATPETLGEADVTTRRLAGRDVYVVESDAGDPVYTLLCRAPDPRSVDSFERSVKAALASTVRAVREERVVPGGGAVETGAAADVREYARSVGRQEQLAVEAFADALTVVPRTLAATAGMDGWEAVADLRAAHAAGRDAVGVDVLAGEPVDVLDGDAPVVDPAGLERDVLGAATDLAVRCIRVDGRLPATEIDPDATDGTGSDQGATAEDAAGE